MRSAARPADIGGTTRGVEERIVTYLQQSTRLLTRIRQTESYRAPWDLLIRV